MGNESGIANRYCAESSATVEALTDKTRHLIATLYMLQIRCIVTFRTVWSPGGVMARFALTCVGCASHTAHPVYQITAGFRTFCAAIEGHRHKGQQSSALHQC